MKRKSVAFAGALLLGLAAQACWPWQVADEEYRDAVPQEEDLTVQIGSDDADLTDPSGALAVAGALDPYVEEWCADELCQEDVGGEPYYVDGEVYQATRSAKWYINGGLVVTLGWIDAILVQPYTEKTADGYMWGPWAESLSRIQFQFLMNKESAGVFSFELDGKNVNAGDGDPWTPVVWGDLETGDEPHASMGSIVLDYTAVHAIDTAYPTPEAGRLTYDFDVREYPFWVDATFEGFAAPDGQVIDALYSYTRYDEGMSGELQFELDADVWPEDAPDGLLEDLVVTSRWNADGEGQGEASATGGTMDADGSLVDELTLEECWAPQSCLFYQTWAEYRASYSDMTPDSVFDECGLSSYCPII
jgi:hypothetical protein